MYAEPGQGERLVGRKAGRRSDPGANAAAGGPADAGNIRYHDEAGGQPRACGRPLSSSSASVPVQQAASASPAAGRDAKQHGGAAAPSRLTDPKELLKTQLLEVNEPLPAPAPRSDDDDDDDGGAGERALLGSYFKEREERARRGGSPLRSAASPATVRSGGQPRDQLGPASELCGFAEPARNRPLKRGDFYHRPDLDAEAQRVVLASLQKEREEEAARRDAAARRREVLLAKFNAQRRERLTLALQSGLPVPGHLLDSFRLAAEPPADRLRREAQAVKARKDMARDEVQQKQAAAEAPRKAELLRHREEMLRTMSQRSLRRTELELSLGTHLGAAVQKAAAESRQTIKDVIAEHAHQARETSAQAEERRALEELSRFDAQARAKLKAQQKAVQGTAEYEARPPRQRDLPYSIDAPYRKVSAHRAPIVMSEAEKKACREQQQQQPIAQAV